MDSQRLSKKDYFLEMVKLVASRSTCPRRAVGAIITTEDGNVLSTGYNGVARGYPHCIDYPCPGAMDSKGDTSNCMAIHAEQNALLQCADISRAYIMYCTNLPCFVCSKLLANTPIKLVYCLEDYADHRGLRLLMQLGIDVHVEGDMIGVKEVS